MTIFDPRLAPRAKMANGLTPVPLPKFGGLRLDADPQELGWAGAVDLLNVDLDRSGRVRQRDGYDNVTSSAASLNYRSVYADSGEGLIFAARKAGTDTLDAINPATGAVLASATGFASEWASFASIGTPTDAYIYASATRSASIRRWAASAAAWTSPAGMPAAGGHLAVQAVDNRLVHAATATGRVSFSGPGTPETFGANDYVDLTPNDGEEITATATWRDMVIVFKETRFFVFYGNSTDSAGDTEFNYRTVTGAGAAIGDSTAVGPEGVYFVGRDGIYLTTGGPPRLVSAAVDPMFFGAVPASFQLGHAAIVSEGMAMTWMNHRLYVALPAAAQGHNDRILVYDVNGDSWTVWNVRAAGLTSFTFDEDLGPELVFSYASGLGAHVGRLSSEFTTDDGTAIDSYYQTGYADLGDAGVLKTIRQWSVDGTGSVNVSAGESDEAPVVDARAQNVMLGTAPAVDTGWHRKSYRGRNFSLKFADVSGGAWSVSRAVAYLRGQRTAGLA